VHLSRAHSIRFVIALISAALPPCTVALDHQIHFYIVPSLDPVPHNIIKPIRNVVTFTVDYKHLMRPPPSTFGGAIDSEPVEFCVIKRSAIAMFALRDKLMFQKVAITTKLSPANIANDGATGDPTATRIDLGSSRWPLPLCRR
jgi:hypothetical protein